MGLGEEEDGSLKIVSKDNQEFEVPMKDAFISKLIKTSIDAGNLLDLVFLKSLVYVFWILDLRI